MFDVKKKSFFEKKTVKIFSTLTRTKEKKIILCTAKIEILAFFFFDDWKQLNC